AGYGGLRLDEREQERAEVLNSYLRLEPLFPWTDRAGVAAAIEVMKRTRPLLQRWKRARRDDIVELRSWEETGDDSRESHRPLAGHRALGLGWSLMRDAPDVIRYAW